MRINVTRFMAMHGFHAGRGSFDDGGGGGENVDPPVDADMDVDVDDDSIASGFADGHAGHGAPPSLRHEEKAGTDQPARARARARPRTSFERCFTPRKLLWAPVVMLALSTTIHRVAGAAARTQGRYHYHGGSGTGSGCPEPFRAGASYRVGDLAEVDGVVYECQADAASDHRCGATTFEPAKGLHWRDAWIELGPCESGDDRACPDDYVPGTEYGAGDAVVVEQVVYECEDGPSSRLCRREAFAPRSSGDSLWESAWKKKGRCVGGVVVKDNPKACPQAWSDSKQYRGGDRIAEGGLVYECLSDSDSIAPNCNSAAYSPGIDGLRGTLWMKAWKEIGPCDTTNVAQQTSPTAPVSSTPSSRGRAASPFSVPTIPKPQMEVALKGFLQLHGIACPPSDAEIDLISDALKATIDVHVEPTLQEGETIADNLVVSTCTPTKETKHNDEIDTIDSAYTLRLRMLCGKACDDSDTIHSQGMATNALLALKNSINDGSFSEKMINLVKESSIRKWISSGSTSVIVIDKGIEITTPTTKMTSPMSRMRDPLVPTAFRSGNSLPTESSMSFSSSTGTSFHAKENPGPNISSQEEESRNDTGEGNKGGKTLTSENIASEARTLRQLLPSSIPSPPPISTSTSPSSSLWPSISTSLEDGIEVAQQVEITDKPTKLMAESAYDINGFKYMGAGYCVDRDGKSFALVHSREIITQFRCAEWCLNIPGSDNMGFVGFERSHSYCACLYRQGLIPSGYSKNIFDFDTWSYDGAGRSSLEVESISSKSGYECYKLTTSFWDNTSMNKYGHSFVGFGDCKDNSGNPYQLFQKELVSYYDCLQYCLSSEENSYHVGFQFSESYKDNMNLCRCLYEDVYSQNTFFKGKGQISFSGPATSYPVFCYKMNTLVERIGGFNFVGYGQCQDSKSSLYDVAYLKVSPATASNCARECVSHDHRFFVGFATLGYLNWCVCHYEDGHVLSDYGNSYSHVYKYQDYEGIGEITSVNYSPSSRCYKMDPHPKQVTMFEFVGVGLCLDKYENQHTLILKQYAFNTPSECVEWCTLLPRVYSLVGFAISRSACGCYYEHDSVESAPSDNFFIDGTGTGEIDHSTLEFGRLCYKLRSDLDLRGGYAKLTMVNDVEMLCLQTDISDSGLGEFKFAPCTSTSETSILDQNFIVQKYSSGSSGQFLLRLGTRQGWDRCMVAGEHEPSLGTCDDTALWQISSIGRITPSKDRTKCLAVNALDGNRAIISKDYCSDESLPFSDISVIPIPSVLDNTEEHELDNKFFNLVFPKSGFQLLGDTSSPYWRFRIAGYSVLLKETTILSFKVTTETMNTVRLHACVILWKEEDSDVNNNENSDDSCIDVFGMGFQSGSTKHYVLSLGLTFKQKLGGEILAIEFKHIGSGTRATSRFHSISLYNPGTATVLSRKEREITVTVEDEKDLAGTYLLPSVTLQDEEGNFGTSVPSAGIVGIVDENHSFTISGLMPGRRFHIELDQVDSDGNLSGNDQDVKIVFEAYTSCTLTTDEYIQSKDETGRPEIFRLAQGSTIDEAGFISFEYSHNSACATAYEMTRRDITGNINSEDIIFVPLYLFKPLSQQTNNMIKPSGLEYKDRVAHLKVGHVYEYNVAAVADNYMVDTIIDDGRFRVSSDKNPKNHTVSWESIATILVTLKKESGSEPVEEVNVVWELLSPDGSTVIRSGSGVTPSNGLIGPIHLKVKPSEAQMAGFQLSDSTQLPLSIKFSKESMGEDGSTPFPHTFLCDEESIVCPSEGFKKYLSHLNFGETVHVADATTISIYGTVYAGMKDDSGDIVGIDCTVSNVMMSIYRRFGDNRIIKLDSTTTNENGEYSLKANIGTWIYIEATMPGHSFEPVTRDINGDDPSKMIRDTVRAIQYNITGYFASSEGVQQGEFANHDFYDTTLAPLTVEVAGGLCDIELGTAVIQVTLENCDKVNYRQEFHQSTLRAQYEVPAHVVEVDLLNIYRSSESDLQYMLDSLKNSAESTRIDLSDVRSSQQGEIVDDEENLDNTEEVTPVESYVRFQYDGVLLIEPRIRDDMDQIGSNCSTYIVKDPVFLGESNSTHVIRTKDNFDIDLYVKQLIIRNESGHELEYCEQVDTSTELFVMNEVGLNTAISEDSALLDFLRTENRFDDFSLYSKCTETPCRLSVEIMDEADSDFRSKASIKLKAGYPKLYGDYSKTITISSGNSKHVMYVVVTGDYGLVQLGSFPMPTLKPLLVIRDPPGGLSSVTYSNVHTTMKISVEEFEKYDGVDGGFSVSKGGKAKVGTCVGAIVGYACTDIVDAEANVGLETGSGRMWLTDFNEEEHSHTLNIVWSYQTSDDQGLAGKQSDVFLVPTLVILLRQTETVLWDENSCSASKEKSIKFDIGSDDTRKALNFITYQQLTSNVLPNLKNQLNLIESNVNGDYTQEQLSTTKASINAWEEVLREYEDTNAKANQNGLVKVSQWFNSTVKDRPTCQKAEVTYEIITVTNEDVNIEANKIEKDPEDQDVNVEIPEKLKHREVSYGHKYKCKSDSKSVQDEAVEFINHIMCRGYSPQDKVKEAIGDYKPIDYQKGEVECIPKDAKVIEQKEWEDIDSSDKFWFLWDFKHTTLDITTIPLVSTELQDKEEKLESLPHDFNTYSIDLREINAVQFSGGGSLLSFEFSTDDSHSYQSLFENPFNNDANSDFHFSLGGFGGLEISVGAGVLAGVNLDAGLSYQTETSHRMTSGDETSDETIVTVELGDPDSSDYFLVDIFVDPKYSTFVFNTVDGLSKCPHEVNTTKVEDPFVTVLADSRPKPVGTATDDEMVFELEVVNKGAIASSFYLYHETSDNPHGLSIDFFGNDVGSWSLEGEGKVQKTTVAVAMGPRGHLTYGSVRVHLHSLCEFDGAFGSAISTTELYNVVRDEGGEIMKYIEFTEPCAEVDFSESNFGKSNSFSINSRSDSAITISITNPSIYKFPHKRLREKRGLNNIWLQYRKISERVDGSYEWINGLDTENDELDFLLAEESIEGLITSKWKYPKINGAYEIRLKSVCSCDGCPANMRRYVSDSVFGNIDLEPPRVLGKPTPSSNLSPGEDLVITFTEELECEMPYSFVILIQISEIYGKLFGNKDLDILCSDNTISIQFNEESIPGMDYNKLYGRTYNLSIGNVKDKNGNAMEEQYVFRSNFLCLPPIPRLEIYQGAPRQYLPHEPIMFEATLSNFQEKWVTLTTLEMPSSLPESGMRRNLEDSTTFQMTGTSMYFSENSPATRGNLRRKLANVFVPGFRYVGDGVCKDSEGNAHDYYNYDLGSGATPLQCGTKCLDRADTWGLVGFQLDYSRYCFCFYEDGVNTLYGVNSRTGSGEIVNFDYDSEKVCYKVDFPFSHVGDGVCKDSQGNAHDYYHFDFESTDATPLQCGSKCLGRADASGLVGFQLDYSRHCYCLYEDGVNTAGGVNSRTGKGEIAKFDYNSEKECYKVKSLPDDHAIAASDGAPDDFYGRAVAISGHVAIVGAWGDDDLGSLSGSAYILRWKNNEWVQETKLKASDGTIYDGFGYSVGIDGNVAVVGAWFDDIGGVDDCGSAYVYRWDDIAWSQEAKLVASDYAEDDRFGYSVAISEDAIIVGTDVYSPSVYVFRIDNNVWNQEAQLTSADGVGGTFGTSVSLSGDVAVVSAYGDASDGYYTGSAYVFRRNELNQWNQEAKLISSEPAAGDYFGYSVGISDDVIVLGAFGDSDKGSRSGSAYVFRWNGVEWKEEAKLVASDGAAGDYFGVTASVSGDVIVIGSRYDDDNGDDSGSAYVFRWRNNQWREEDKLIATGVGAGDSFGYRLSISVETVLVGSASRESVYVFSLSPPSTPLLPSDWASGVSNWNNGNYYGSFGTSLDISNDVAIVSRYGDDDKGAFSGSAYIFRWSNNAWNQEAKLVASDGATYDRFGMSVAINGDVAIVGAPEDDDLGDRSGSVYVYRRSGTQWIQEAKLVASDGASIDLFGGSVGVSGNVVVVAAALDDDKGSYSGSVYVFRYGDNQWIEEAKLVPNDGVTGDQFGIDVAIDGDIILAGAHGDDDLGSYSGSAYVFRFSNNNWIQEAKILASDGSSNSQFGYSVSVSGTIAIVGAFSDDSVGTDIGSAYIFRYVDGQWNEEAKLISPDGAAYDNFGKSVAISANVAIVGSPRDDDGSENSGSAFVFRFKSGQWSQEAKLDGVPGGVSSGLQFGHSVAISGELAVVGSGTDIGLRDVSPEISGVFGYELTPRSSTIVSLDGAPNDFFGYSVAISGDVAIVGAYRDDDRGNDSGSAYILRWDGGQWSQRAKLVPSDGSLGDMFGISVGIDGSVAVVGAFYDDDDGEKSGSAYVFRGNAANQWVQEAKLVASDGDAGDFFGCSVAVSGGAIIVGAQYDEDDGINSGSAYIFHWDSAKWNEEKKLLAPDGGVNYRFGTSVDISDDLAIVGAYGDDGFRGSAHVFHYGDDGQWNHQAKLVALDRSSSDYFGRSVAISGSVVIVGANGDDDNGESSGSAYIFLYTGNEWIQQAKLVASDGTASNNFGISVDISGDVAVVGSHTNDDLGVNSGSAYLFRRSGSQWSQESKLVASNGASGDYFGFSVAVSTETAIVGSIYGEAVSIFNIDPSPTSRPSISSMPSDWPSSYPSRILSDWPSSNPSLHPTSIPSHFPSSSLAPSLIPSTHPSFVPSAIPSVAPSLTPSTFPSLLPSATPSTTPSLTPSNSPSLAPSAFPSDTPSSTPSTFPSLVPSTSPSMTPSTTPSTRPSLVPSAYPSDAPSLTPSAEPSHGPHEVESINGKAVIDPQGKQNEHRFGHSVAMSEDILVVGAPFYDSPLGVNSGRAYVYRWDKDITTWKKEAELKAPKTSSNLEFGVSVGISNNYIVVGSTGPNDGAAFVFHLSPYNLKWEFQTTLIEGNECGRSVSIIDTSMGVSGSSSVGAFAIVGCTGAAHIYYKHPDESDWVETQHLKPPSKADEDIFGSHVDIDGNLAVVSVPGKEVHVYRHGSSAMDQWSHEAVLSAEEDDVVVESLSRTPLKVSGDLIIRGSPSQNAVMVHRWDMFDGWSNETVVLKPNDVAEGDLFGWSVDISDDTVIVGSCKNENSQGAAYVYLFDEIGVWSQKMKLVSSSPAINDHFGAAVAISKTMAIVGSPLDDYESWPDNGSIASFNFLRYFTTSKIRDESLASNSYLELGVDVRTNNDDFTVLVNGEPLVSDQIYPLGGGDDINTTIALLKGPGKQLRFHPLSMYLRSHCVTDSSNPIEVSSSLWNWEDEHGEKFIKYTPPCPAVEFAGVFKTTSTVVLNKQAFTNQGSKLPVSIWNVDFVDRKLYDRSIHNPSAAFNDLLLEDIVLLFRRAGDLNNSHWEEGLLFDANGASMKDGRPVDFSMDSFEDDFGIISLDWGLLALEDGMYDVKIQSRCHTVSDAIGAQEFSTPVVNVVIDRTPPAIYGTPVLQSGSSTNFIQFTEDIYCQGPFVFDLHVVVTNEGSISVLKDKSGLQVVCESRFIKFFIDSDDHSGSSNSLSNFQYVVHLSNVEDLARNSMDAAFEASMTTCAQNFLASSTKLQGCNGIDDNCDGVIDDCAEDLFPPVISIMESVERSYYEGSDKVAYENILFIRNPSFGSLEDAKSFLMANLRIEDDCARELDVAISSKSYGSCADTLVTVDASDPRCTETNEIQNSMKGFVFRVDSTPPNVFVGSDLDHDPEFFDDDGKFLHIRESSQAFKNIQFWYNVVDDCPQLVDIELEIRSNELEYSSSRDNNMVLVRGKKVSDMTRQTQIFIEPKSCQGDNSGTDLCESDPDTPVRFYEIEVKATDYGMNVNEAKLTVIVVPQNADEIFFSSNPSLKTATFFVDLISQAKASNVLHTKESRFEISHITTRKTTAVSSPESLSDTSEEPSASPSEEIMSSAPSMADPSPLSSIPTQVLFSLQSSMPSLSTSQLMSTFTPYKIVNTTGSIRVSSMIELDFRAKPSQRPSLDQSITPSLAPSKPEPKTTAVVSLTTKAIVTSCPEGTVKEVYEKATAEAARKSAQDRLDESGSDTEIVGVEAQMVSCTPSAGRKLSRGIVSRVLQAAIETNIEIQTSRLCGDTCDDSDVSTMSEEISLVQQELSSDINSGAFATEVQSAVQLSEAIPSSGETFDLVLEQVDDTSFGSVVIETVTAEPTTSPTDVPSASPSILPSAMPSLLMSSLPSVSVMPSSSPSDSPTQPKPQLEITMPGTITLGSFNPPPTTSPAFQSFVTAFEDTVRDIVQKSLKQGQRLLAVNVRTIGGTPIVDRRANRSLQVSLTKVEYDIVLEQLCDSSTCERSTVLANEIYEAVSNSIAAAIEDSSSNGFAAILVSYAKINGVEYLAAVITIEDGTFGSLSVTKIFPNLYYPDWSGGSTSRCINDGNEPEYMRTNGIGAYVFEDLKSCCEKHFSWDLVSCLESDSTAVVDSKYSDLYYPDWEGNNDSCRKNSDGLAPAYMTNDPTAWMHETLESCCTKNYGWRYNDCIADGSSSSSEGSTTTSVGSNKWFVDYDNTKCVQDCNDPQNASCGGLASPWETLYDTADDCCKGKVYWVQSAICVSLSTGNNFDGSGKWYVDWEAQDCVMDCESVGPSCGGFAEPWDDLYASASECCKQRLPWKNDCGSSA